MLFEELYNRIGVNGPQVKSTQWNILTKIEANIRGLREGYRYTEWLKEEDHYFRTVGLLMTCPVLKQHPGCHVIVEFMHNAVRGDVMDLIPRHGNRKDPVHLAGQAFLDRYAGYVHAYDENWLDELQKCLAEIVKKEPSLKKYTDFLYQRECRLWLESKHHDPGTVQLVQSWRIAQDKMHPYDEGIVITALKDLEVAYKDHSSGHRFWENEGLDYSCPLGVEERFQWDAKQVEGSLIVEGEESYQLLMSEYVRESLLFLINGDPGVIGRSSLTVNETIAKFAQLVSREYLLNLEKSWGGYYNEEACLSYVVDRLFDILGRFGEHSWLSWCLIAESKKSLEAWLKKGLVYIVEDELGEDRRLVLRSQNRVTAEDGTVTEVYQEESLAQITDRIVNSVESLRRLYIKTVVAWFEVNSLDSLVITSPVEIDWLLEDKSLFTKLNKQGESFFLKLLKTEKKDSYLFECILQESRIVTDQHFLFFQDGAGKTFLHHAVSRKWDCMDHFLEKYDFDERVLAIADNKGQTPLHIAYHSGNSEYLKLNAGISESVLKMQTKTELETLLHIAIKDPRKGQAYLRTLLRLHNMTAVTLKLQNKMGRTALMEAARNNPHCYHLLFQHWACDQGVIRIKDKLGRALIHHLALHHRHVLLKKLLDHHEGFITRESFKEQDQMGKTVLHLALMNINRDILKDLMEVLYTAEQFDPEILDLKDNYGKTVFHYLFKHDIDIVENFLALPMLQKKHFFAKDNNGENPVIQFITEKCHYEVFFLILKVLFNEGILSDLIKEQDNVGETILHKMARYRYLSAFELLCRYDKMTEFDFSIRDNQGKTAIHYLFEEGGVESLNIIKMLLDTGRVTQNFFKIGYGKGEDFVSSWSSLGKKSIDFLLRDERIPAEVFDSRSFIWICLKNMYLWTLITQIVWKIKSLIFMAFTLSYAAVAPRSSSQFKSNQSKEVSGKHQQAATECPIPVPGSSR